MVAVILVVELVPVSVKVIAKEIVQVLILTEEEQILVQIMVVTMVVITAVQEVVKVLVIALVVQDVMIVVELRLIIDCKQIKRLPNSTC